MTIDEIELYDVEAVDEILSHLSDEDANVVQRAISSLCGMITIRDKYIKELREKILQAGNILGLSQNMKLNVFQAAFKTLLQIRSGLIYYDIYSLKRGSIL